MVNNVEHRTSRIEDDRSVRHLGVFVVFLVFGVLGAWASLAPIDGAALAPGVITVENYRKTVQHLEGGIVKSLEVRDGDRVAKDQALAVLDDTQPRTQLEVLRGQYYIDAAREARLIAQRDGAAFVRYPTDLLASEDIRAREAIAIQNQTFHTRRSALEGEIALYRQQIDELRQKSRGLAAEKAGADRLVTSYRAELEDFSSLLKEGFVEKQKVRELERNLAQSEGHLGELLSNIAAIDLQINETELKIVQLRKEFQREIAKELAEVDARQSEIREKMQSLEATVSRAVIKAPEAGMIMNVQVHTLGAVLPPGGRLLDIVPQDERLVVEVRISPVDIDRVKTGQPAEVRFTAFKSRETPFVEGRLVTISADRIVDERDPNKVPYYLGRVEVSPEGFKVLAEQDMKLMPGMPAEVLIRTGSRTFISYLTKPLTDTFARSFIED